MKKLFFIFTLVLPFIISISFAFDAEDSDPNRWHKVKRWHGKYTLVSNDEVVRNLGSAVMTTKTDIKIEGVFTLTSQELTPSGGLVWKGDGTSFIKYKTELESKDAMGNVVNNVTSYEGSSDIPFDHQTENVLRWSRTIPGKENKYLLYTGDLSFPVSINQTYLPPMQQTMTIAGPSSIGEKVLPEKGYKITGLAVVSNIHGFHKGWISWELEPLE